MKINRPLSPHLTVYVPQLTSTLSIFHRITGAFMAFTLLMVILCLKIFDLSLSFYPIYLCLFHTITQFNWILFGLSNLTLLALCYHISNGVRYLLWDLGFFFDLSKVYASGASALLCTFLLALLTFFRL